MNTTQSVTTELTVKQSIDGTTSSFYLKLSLLVLSFCFVELLRAWQLHGFTRAESAFVEGARDMLVHKQYIAPLFHGVPYFDKPPLHYWLIILFYKIFGVSLPIARTVSIVAAALTLVATSILVKSTLGERVSLMAATILATTVGFYELGSTAMPDMLLCLVTIIAVAFAYKILFDASRDRLTMLLVMAAAFACGWMTKGPIAILIPALSIFFYSVLVKQLPRISPREMTLILVTFLVIVVPWHLALYKNYGFPAFDWLYLRGNIKRFVGLDPGYNFGHPINYMTTTLLTGFLPWTIFLIPAIYVVCRTFFNKTDNRATNKFLLFMFCWAFCNTAFFSFSWSNWCYYSLPIYPALSVLAAQFIADLAGKFTVRLVQLVFATAAGGFFFAAIIYALVFLPDKAKKNGYLNFAAHVNEMPSRIPFFFHSHLGGQYLLVDHITFESGRMPLSCGQDELIKKTFAFNPFVVLLPSHDFEELPPSCKSKLKIIDVEPIKWINFSGCTLAKQAPIGKPILVVLASHNCVLSSDVSDFANTVAFENNKQIMSNASDTVDTQRHMIDGLASWWFTKAYFAEQQPPHIIILGDSSLGSMAGADSYVYGRTVDLTGDHRSYTIQHDLKSILHQNWRVLIGALPDSMMSDQLIASRALFSSNYKPRLVAVMLSPREFIDSTCYSPSSSEPFAFFSRHIQVKELFKLQPTARHQNSNGTMFCPLQLPNCLEKSRTERLGTPNGNFESNSPLTFGRAFERIAPGEITITSSDGNFFDDNIQKYKEIYKSRDATQLSFQLDCLDKLFKYLKQQHISVIAVEMPITNANYILLPHSFWSFYHRKITDICQKNDVDYWDTRSIWDDFPKTEFCDTAHLSLRGGLKMTRPIVLGTAYKLHLPMYTYNGNFGPLVPGKEKIYFNKTWSGVSK